MSGKATGWVFDYSPLRETKLVIHLAIADVVNDAHDNQFWMTTSELAKKAHASRATVTRTLAELVNRGMLQVLIPGGGRGLPTTYRFLTPEVTASGSNSFGEVKLPQTRRETASLATETASNAEITPSYRTEELQQKEQKRVPPLEQVFEAWKQSTGRNGRTVLDSKRRRCILDALKGYPLEDVVDAVRGWNKSTFHAGQNQDRKVYNELTLLLRDGEHIEQFRDLERGTAPIGRNPDPVMDHIQRQRELEGRA